MRSDRNHGRRVVDEVADVRALADELGFDQAESAEGRAGDRMHSRARRLPIVSYARSAMSVSRRSARLGRAGCLACRHGSGERQGVRLGARRRGRPHRELQALQQQFEERARVDPSTILQDVDMSESDRAELARPEMAQILRESTFEWAVNGVGGWVDDDLDPAAVGDSTLRISPCRCSSATG